MAKPTDYFLTWCDKQKYEAAKRRAGDGDVELSETTISANFNSVTEAVVYGRRLLARDPLCLPMVYRRFDFDAPTEQGAPWLYDFEYVEAVEA